MPEQAYLHGGGMILGSVPIFDGTVSRYVARTDRQRELRAL